MSYTAKGTLTDRKKVWIAECYRPYYEGGNIFIGVFSSEEKAWQIAREILSGENQEMRNLSGEAEDYYPESDLTIYEVEMDQGSWE